MPIRLLSPDQLSWTSLSIPGADRDLVADAFVVGDSSEDMDGPGLATGFVEYSHLETDVSLSYEEIGLVLEGSIKFVTSDQDVVVSAGQLFNLRRGTVAHVSVTDRCRVFFITYPANWRNLG